MAVYLRRHAPGIYIERGVYFVSIYCGGIRASGRIHRGPWGKEGDANEVYIYMLTKYTPLRASDHAMKLRWLQPLALKKSRRNCSQAPSSRMQNQN